MKAMFLKEFEYKEEIITYGDEPDFFYIVSEGEVWVQVFAGEGFEKPGELLQQKTLYPGSAFGEISLLGECKRTATVIVKTKKVKLWALDRKTFENIICYFSMERRDFYLESLEEIFIL